MELELELIKLNWVELELTKWNWPHSWYWHVHWRWYKRTQNRMLVLMYLLGGIGLQDHVFLCGTAGFKPLTIMFTVLSVRCFNWTASPPFNFSNFNNLKQYAEMRWAPFLSGQNCDTFVYSLNVLQYFYLREKYHFQFRGYSLVALLMDRSLSLIKYFWHHLASILNFSIC